MSYGGMNMSDYAASAQLGVLERSQMLSSLNYSGNSSNSDRDFDVSEHSALLRDESDEEEDAFISFTTTESRCESLFQQGLELKLRGDVEDALLCFEDCLRGMRDCQYFAKLPQTLQHLKHLYRVLGNEDKADEYGEADKLFQEATEPKLSSPSLNNGSQPRSKRKPFSKKTPSILSSSVCNPAEYGNLMVRKALEYEKLARSHVEKGNMDVAMSCCKKAVVLRNCVRGQTAPVVEEAMALLEYVYGELEKRSKRLSVSELSYETNKVTDVQLERGPAKGDLSVPSPKLSNCMETKDWDEHEATKVDTGIQSANFSRPHSAAMWSAPTDMCSHWHSDENQARHCVNVPAPSSWDRQESLGMPSTQGHGTEEGYSAGIGETRLGRDFTPSVVQVSSTNGSCLHCDHTPELNGGKEPPSPDKPDKTADPEPCWVVPVQPHFNSHPHHLSHHKNLCKGVTKGVKNLTKLSAELKAPMCVTLDVQTVKSDRGAMEHPRCLPLWVLLLGAFVEMALLAYMLYHH